MNRFLWLVVNFGLVVTACAFGLWLAESDPAGRWGAISAQALEQPGPEAMPKSVQDKPERSVPAARRHPQGAPNLDALWRRSLFRPERTEDIELRQEIQRAQEEPQRKVEFELVAVGMRGERRVAILDVKESAPPRPPPTVAATVRPGVTVRGPGGRIPQAQETARPARTKRLYREGDDVGGTGYILAEIRRKEVLLKKGEEELVISIEIGDEASKARRAAAANAAAVAQAREAAQAPPPGQDTPGAAANIPPPPPPPPVPGVMPPATIPSPHSETVDQRVQRIREERERLLRERLKASENPN